MSDVNSFAFTGRMARDAEVKSINGKTLVELSIANNTGYGDYAKTNWLRVKWWGDRAANAAPIFKKGALVGGSGELNLTEWTGKDGATHNQLEVTVFGLQLLAQAKQNSGTVPAEEQVVPEDIPF